MTNTEATILVNQGIYEAKSEIRSHIRNSTIVGLFSGLAGAGVTGFFAVPFVEDVSDMIQIAAVVGGAVGAIATIIYDIDNSMEFMEAKAQLKLLKAIKKELVQGSALFEDVEVKDFQKKLGEYR